MTASVRKIRLNFGAISQGMICAMSSETMEAGGYIEPPPMPPREREIADKMPDGTVYAGVSPDTGQPMYAMPIDEPLTYTFNGANRYAKKLDAHGHKDWRVPTKAELNVLFNNRAAIGGFDVTSSNPAGWYWSSSSSINWIAWVQRFSDGAQGSGCTGGHSSVRCVR